METENIMTNEEVIEVAEEITKNDGYKVLKVVGGIGLAVLVGAVAYRYIAKPVIARYKAKKMKPNIIDDPAIIDIESTVVEKSEHEKTEAE